MQPDRPAIFGKNKTGPLPLAENSVWVRKQRTVDAASLKAFFSNLSAQTLFSRFMIALPAIPPSILDRLCYVDGDKHVGIVAQATNGTLIAEARYVCNEGSKTSAEFALTVADDWRGIGLATSMMEKLEMDACQNGIEALWADALTNNTAMLNLARKLGYQVSRHPEDPCCKILTKHLTGAQDMKKAA